VYKSEGDLLRLSGYCGNFRFESFDFKIMKDYGSAFENTKRLGTIGLDFLINKVLFVDYPNAKFYLSNADDDINMLEEELRFESIEIVYNALILKFQINETVFLDMLFDTGSSLFELVVRHELWKTLTNRTGQEDDNFRITVNALVKPIEIVGAFIQGSLQVLNKEFVNSMAYYVVDDKFFSQDMQWLDGIMGNSLFYDKYMMIMDLINNRIGLVEL
jgi:hypothetical protein